MLLQNESRSQTKSWWLTSMLFLTCIEVYGFTSFASSEVATNEAAKAIGDVFDQNFRKVPISLMSNRNISNDFQNPNVHKQKGKMPEAFFYKQHERYTLPFRSFYNPQKFNQHYSRPTVYFKSKENYNKNTEIKPSSLEYFNKFNQFQRNKFPYKETYSALEDRNKKSRHDKHENRDSNFKFNITIREHPTEELFDGSKSSEKNEYYSRKSTLKKVPQMGISEHDLKALDLNQNSERYRKLKLNETDNLNPLYKMSDFSNLRSSLSNKNSFNEISNVPYYTKREKLRKLTPFVTQTHKYYHKNEEENSEYFDQPQRQLLTNYDKHGTTNSKNKLTKSNLPHAFHTKLQFKRVKYKALQDNMLDEYPVKNSREYKVNKYAGTFHKNHINRTALDTIIKLEQEKNHGINDDHKDIDNSLITRKVNDKLKKFSRTNQNQTNLKKNKLLYVQDPSNLWNANFDKYESAYLNSKNHSPNYKSNNDFNNEENAKNYEVIRKNLNKNSGMSNVLAERVSAITETGIELHNNNLIRHITGISEVHNSTGKLDELQDLSLVKLKSAKQNDRFSRHKSRSEDNFIQVQVFGDFLKNSMLGRHRKESSINDMIPQVGSAKNQRTKRQEAIFIVMALVGVTAAIMSVTCIALIISRKRNKKKKSKKSKSSNDREQQENDSDKITTLSVVHHPASCNELGMEKEIIQRNSSKMNSILSVYSGMKQQEETKARKSFTNIAMDYEEEYFSDHSHSYSEDEEINKPSGNKRARQTRSLPINRFQSYPLKRQSFNGINQQLEPNFENKIIDRMDFNEEYENTENGSNESYRGHSEFSMDSEGDITLNKNIKREFSYISLNLEENIQFNENLPKHYGYGMGCFQENSADEFKERPIIKSTRTNNGSIENVVQATSRSEQRSLSHEKNKNISSCGLKRNVQEHDANEMKTQRISHKQSEGNFKFRDDGKGSLGSPTNRHQCMSPPVTHNETIIEKIAGEHKMAFSEDINGEKSERRSQERLGSPWSRVLAMKPRSAQKHYSELDKSGDTKILAKGSLNENSENKNFSKFSHEKNLNSLLPSEKKAKANETKKNHSNKRQSWKDINIKRCSEGTFNKPIIISNFRA